jgi:hypothetical protein
VIHARTWIVDDGVLVIEDELRGTGHHRVEAFLHLAAGIEPETLADGSWSLGGGVRLETDAIQSWTCNAGTLHPAMGVVVPAFILATSVAGTLPMRLRTTIRWR